MLDKHLKKLYYVICFLGVFGGLFSLSKINYILFHTIAEIFSIVVAVTLFMVVWNSKKYMENKYLVLIGIAYLFIAALDLLHTLSYKGVRIFLDYEYYANQLWIAARYMESITLLIGFSFYYRRSRINPYGVLVIYGALTALLIASILVWKVFPVCFVEGEGQTLFKKISEYIISFILVMAGIILLKRRKDFDKGIFNLLIGSIVFTMLSELTFTLYTDNYGLLNLIGHCLKIISFYLIYKAIIETGITRPYQLIFRELAVAKESAEVANRLKSDFLANVSHEIRTPMNSMMGFTNILLEEEEDEDKKEKLEIIMESGNHLLNLINEILDFSKIEAGKMVIDQTKFSVHKMINDIKKMLILRIQEKGLYFQVKMDATVPKMVVGDEYRIRQILINLIGNAIKFTGQGGITLECLYKNGYLEIKVKDTGIGIPQEKQNQIFSAFEQVDGSTTRKYGGTGLGLAITKKLVEMMAGKIEVESVVGEGSVFTIHIPLENARVSQEEEKYLNEEELDHGVEEWERTKIAFITDAGKDESFPILMQLEKGLSKRKYSFTMVQDNYQMVKNVTQKKIDMILVHGQGREGQKAGVVEKLKDDFRLAWMPIILIVLKDDGGISYQVVSDADQYIGKQHPVHINELIERYFERKQELGQKMVGAWFEKVESELGLGELVFDGISNLCSMMGTLESAIMDNNKDNIKYLTHAIRGGMANIRMDEFSGIAYDMEKEASKSDYDLKKIKSEYTKMKDLLSRIPEKYIHFTENEKINKQKIFKAMKILVVEDNELNQKLMDHFMEKAGFNYKIVENGEIALKALSEETFDLVLLDSQMPGMDGLETLKRIKADQKLKGMKVVMLTANVIREDIESFFRAGCDDYISKPINREILKKKIMEFASKA